MAKRRLRKPARKPEPPSAQSAPATAQRDPATGRWLQGNTSRLVHGLGSPRARQGLLPEQTQLLAAVADRRNELLAGLGTDLSVVKRDAAERWLELTVIADTLFDNLTRHGVLSPKGRQRAALNAFLSVCDRLSRLAAQLGFERATKRIPSNAMDYFAQQFRERQAQEAGEEPTAP